MNEFFALMKKGNKASLIAATVNTVIAISKLVAYILTANVAMLAAMFHSFGDAANQFFVYIGSAFSKKAPTERFPNGFGRLVNLVLLGAVLIVGIMSYEAIREGIHAVFHPSESTGLAINVGVLVFAIVLECFVLYKAMKEILHETQQEAKGLAVIPVSIQHLKDAKPATKLVFLEDCVATLGGVLALAGILIAHYTSFAAAEGVASILIGCMMFFVVAKVFMDNAAGVIGESDDNMEADILAIFQKEAHIKGVKEVVVVKEGEHFHVEADVFVDANLTVALADDIRDGLSKQIHLLPGVTDIRIEMEPEDEMVTSKEETKK